MKLEAPNGKMFSSYRAAWDFYYSIEAEEANKKSKETGEPKNKSQEGKIKDNTTNANTSSDTSSSKKAPSKAAASNSHESINEANSTQKRSQNYLAGQSLVRYRN